MAKAPYLVPCLACALLLLTGALNHQAPSSTPAGSADFLAQSPSAEAGPLLAQVIAAYSLSAGAGQGIQWLDLTIRQKVNHGDGSFETEGRLVLAPGERCRLEMTSTAPREGKLLRVSDGTQVREILHSDTEEPHKSPVPMPEGEEKRRNFLKDQGFGGPGALLRRLHAGLGNLRQRTGLWRGRPVIQITGDWASARNLPDQALPPRTCTVYLEAKSLWPFRLEWWGAVRSGDPIRLIMEMEFRDPVVNQSLPDAECARLFSCH